MKLNKIFEGGYNLFKEAYETHCFEDYTNWLKAIEPLLCVKDGEINRYMMERYEKEKVK